MRTRTPYRRGDRDSAAAGPPALAGVAVTVLRIEATMGWAAGHIEKLRRGETVSFRPRGNSMTGKIESGQLCTVQPLGAAGSATLRVGDIVLCKVKGHEYLHLVKAIRGHQFQIGNNRGGINGWVTAKSIFG